MPKSRMKKSKKLSSVIISSTLAFLFLATLAFAQKPLCLPIEYETSPFFVHFTRPGAPTLIVIHGGFSSTAQTALFCRRFTQVLGDRYNIVSVDYRFSSIGGGEMVDVMRGIRLARERFKTPRERVFIIGTSHGGYLALMAASRTRVGGVVDAYGPTYWPIQLEYVRKHRPEIFKKWRIYLAISKSACREMGLEFSQCLVKRSVVSRDHLKNLKDPVLILHGEKDRLVPLKESRLLAKKLKEMGRKVTFRVFPEKGHAFPLWKGRALETIKAFLLNLEKEER